MDDGPRSDDGAATQLTAPQRRYHESDADSARWAGFEFRAGDVVVDAPSKSGTTWTQLLVALLIFGGDDFPEPIGRMSPWMEHLVEPATAIHARLAAQSHRRFIKSHTPLDGIPMRDDVAYVCVGRDPRDAAVSLLHHQAHMRHDRRADLVAAQGGQAKRRRPPVRGPAERARYFEHFINDDDPAGTWSLRSLAHHYATFWERRSLPNFALFHFGDYGRDLPGEIRRLAGHLDIPLAPRAARALARLASIDRARQRAADIAPEAHLGLWDDPAAFFRDGGDGHWQAELDPAQVAAYERRVGELMPADLAWWVHHGWTG